MLYTSRSLDFGLPLEIDQNGLADNLYYESHWLVIGLLFLLIVRNCNRSNEAFLFQHRGRGKDSMFPLCILVMVLCLQFGGLCNGDSCFIYILPRGHFTMIWFDELESKVLTSDYTQQNPLFILNFVKLPQVKWNFKWVYRLSLTHLHDSHVTEY